mmetsp:Transcript_50757/g.94902  ORF Transcript_50757/g.94902 Transcript_50757/m.94902 type:complete len:248 (+) Transcript_50757:299-1042(+)
MYFALMAALSGSICRSAISVGCSLASSLASPLAFLSSFFLGLTSDTSFSASGSSFSCSAVPLSSFLEGSLYLLTSRWMASFSRSPFFLLTRAGLMSLGLLGPPSSSSSSSRLANMFLEVEILTCPLLSSKLIADDATDLASDGYFLSSRAFEAASLFLMTPQAGAVVSSSFSFSSSRTSFPATSTFMVAWTTSSSCQPSSSSALLFLASFFSSAGFSFMALLRLEPLIFFFLSFLKKSLSVGASAMR